MKQRFMLLLVALSIMCICSVEAITKNNKQQMLRQISVAKEIAKNNFSLSLKRDDSIEKKINIFNLVSRKQSVLKESDSFIQLQYNAETGDVEKKTLNHNEYNQIMLETHAGKISMKNNENTFFTGKIQVGPQNSHYKMIFDSGSTLIFLNSVECTDIGCQRGNQYNSKLSKTFKDVDVGVEVEFGSGILRGEMGIDNFYLNDMVVKKVEFMEITEEVGAVFEDGNFDGLIGLAFPKLGKGTKTVVDIMKEQKLIEKMQFSFYMSREVDSEDSFISFGEVNHSLIDGEIQYHDVKSALYWTLLCESIKIGKEDSLICSDDNPCPLAIDSGTSIIAGPSKSARKLVQMLYDRGFGCDEISKMPTITFVIDGIDYPLLPEEYMLSADGYSSSMYHHSDQPTECKAAFIDIDIDEPNYGPMWILGDLFMSKYYTVFDREQERVGFGKLKSFGKQFYVVSQETEEFDYSEDE